MRTSDMRNRIRGVNEEWADLIEPMPLQVRIGIDTGFRRVGNFRSEDRLDQSALAAGEHRRA